jgi:hypothetical protein
LGLSAADIDCSQSKRGNETVSARKPITEARELAKLPWADFLRNTRAWIALHESDRDELTREYRAPWRAQWAAMRAEARRRGEQLTLF